LLGDSNGGIMDDNEAGLAAGVGADASVDAAAAAASDSDDDEASVEEEMEGPFSPPFSSCPLFPRSNRINMSRSRIATALALLPLRC